MEPIIKTAVPMWVCEDCYNWIENGQLPDMYANEIAVWRTAFERRTKGYDVTIGRLVHTDECLKQQTEYGMEDEACICDHRFFVTAPCDTCEMPYAGERHAATLTPNGRPFTARCPECGRVFDMANDTDAYEAVVGHDCEV